MVIHVQKGDQKSLQVKFAYTKERVTKVKAIPGCRWHPEERYWTVADTADNIKRLLKLFKDEEIEMQGVSDPVGTSWEVKCCSYRIMTRG